MYGFSFILMMDKRKPIHMICKYLKLPFHPNTHFHSRGKAYQLHVHGGFLQRFNILTLEETHHALPQIEYISSELLQEKNVFIFCCKVVNLCSLPACECCVRVLLACHSLLLDDLLDSAVRLHSRLLS